MNRTRIGFSVFASAWIATILLPTVAAQPTEELGPCDVVYTSYGGAIAGVGTWVCLGAEVTDGWRVYCGGGTWSDNNDNGYYDAGDTREGYCLQTPP